MMLKVITSNIRFASANDGIHPWKERRFLLQSIFEHFDVDILGTQEGRENQIKELASSMSNLELIDDHRNYIAERMYPSLFINPLTIDVLDSGDIWLSNTPDVPGSSSFDSAFPRLCIWAHLKIKKINLDILVVNTHLDFLSQETRKNQINVLIKEIKKIRELPVMIMGDFNEAPNTALKKKLMLAFDLKDPWDEKNIPEETSHHGFLGKDTSGDRIDWILVPKNYLCTSIAMEKRFTSDGMYPSDHYPILATFIPK